MKRTQMTIAMLALVTVFMSTAQAADKRVSGMIIGGGTGALVGQAIGRNAQATIIGATVGGVTGLLIGNELERQHRPAYYPRHGRVYQENYSYRGYERRHRPVVRDSYRSYRDTCRKVVTVKKGYHRTKRVVTTICDNYPRHHYGNRF